MKKPADPNKLTVDYRDMLKAATKNRTTGYKRNEEDPTSIGAMTPGEYAKRFPLVKASMGGGGKGGGGGGGASGALSGGMQKQASLPPVGSPRINPQPLGTPSGPKVNKPEAPVAAPQAPQTGKPSGLFNPISATRLSGSPGSHSASMGRGGHQGVDMFAKAGSPVYAVQEGVITRIGTDNFGQPTLTIKHPDGKYSRYLHMKDNHLKVGDEVKGGQQVGTSGAANGAEHLHFERWTQEPNRAGAGLLNPRDEFKWGSTEGTLKNPIVGAAPILIPETEQRPVAAPQPQQQTPQAQPQTQPGVETKKTYDSSSFGSVISKGESGSKGYNAYNRGTAGHGGPDIDFSKMTLGEVMKEQSKRNVFAVGKYQVIPNTMKSAVDTLKLDPNQKFTPELQEKIFSEYLAGHKRPQIKDYVTGNGDLGKAHLATAQEWAAVAAPGSNQSYYAGSAGNAASISGDQIKKSLEKARGTYQDLVKKGVDPQEAYAKAVSGVSEQPTTTTTADKPTKYAVIAMGTNDFSNPAKTKQHTLNLIKHAQSQGLTPVVVPPNANDPRFKAVSDEVRKAAQEAGVQIRDGKYSTKDPLHLTMQDAKTIRESYPGAVHYGDSNAVRISGGPTPTAKVGATTEAINQMNNVQAVAPVQTTAPVAQTASPAAPAASPQAAPVQAAPTPQATPAPAPAPAQKAPEPTATPAKETPTSPQPKPTADELLSPMQYGGDIPAPDDGAQVVNTTGELVFDFDDQQGHKPNENLNSQNTYVDEQTNDAPTTDEPMQQSTADYIQSMMQELTTSSESPFMTSSYERAIKKATFFNEEGDQTIGGHFSFGSTTVNSI